MFNLRARTTAVALLGAVCATAFPRLAAGQIEDQVLVYAMDSNFKLFLHRYDRRFNLLGSTSMAGVAVDSLLASNPTHVNGAGEYLIALDQLNAKKLLRFDARGSLLGSKDQLLARRRRTCFRNLKNVTGYQ